eukprot:TRINITY_DN10527_c0_g1_i6.p1 TRINITY_DN10527_c0_g1~~TRINITY_DN10527_c0_g1_i6.p1  ORF type:complete len:106 (-),score=26.86 TRINITY_DN10527_c0_g1_i6:31-348(-)
MCIRDSPNFHQQLSKCMAKYIKKDSKCATQIYNGILKYWPITNSIKEVNFLNEIEELVEACNDTSLFQIEKEIFKKLCKCICLSLIHICRCRRYAVCRSRWSPYH